MTRPSFYRCLLVNPALRSLQAWLANPQPTRRGTYRPRLEELEDRVVPTTLVIDPKNLVVSATPAGPVPQYNLVNPGSGGSFGTDVVPLPNGNVVVTDPTVNNYAGAVYLFNGASGALISTLSGSVNGDQVGSGGVTVLANGNFLVSSEFWAGHMGAVTWGSATTGVSGTVSAADSLVGTSALSSATYSFYGGGGTFYTPGKITALADGNYVVSNPFTMTAQGTVTWGSGTTGVVGTVSAANSLVGTTAGQWVTNGGQMSGESFYNGGDQIGTFVTALTNSNYVISSPYWNDRTGAVTWASGATGLTGTVSAANSLVGRPHTSGFGRDFVGFVGVTALTNGNYVVSSPYFNGGPLAGTGAVTWANGATGLVGTVSAANSLVGSSSGDQVGSPGFDQVGPPGVTALSNGDYVVDSASWSGGAGAVTWGNGYIGTTGTVSAGNSLVGTVPNGSGGFGGDRVGGGSVTALVNGNYVVASPDWNSHLGAATWGNGSTGIAGTISVANSLIGSSPNWDFVGTTVTPLTNGNYVVGSPQWNGHLGAATWGSGTSGVAGGVTAVNSLVGTNPSDAVGTAVTALTNGNYVVSSPAWNGHLGAATWGSGSTGIVGAVSALNSLVGASANDAVGKTVTALSNGNYVVGSPNWNGNIGAATWGSGTGASVGTLSAANSLVGTSAGDMVGAGVTPLPDGDYVVASSKWNIGQGAATWASGTSGITLDGQSTIDPQNSLVGAPFGPPVSNTAGVPAPVLSVSAGLGGSLQGTYYYVITATTASGETTASNEVQFTASPFGIGTPQLTWGQVPGATGYKIYRATASGKYTYPIATIGTGTQVRYNDNGTLSDNLAKVTAGPAAGTFLAAFTVENGGRVTVGLPLTLTVSPAFLTSALAAGTHVVLQASNDVTVSDPVSVTPSGTAGSLTLAAGRNILLNASIATGGRNLTLIANQSKANGVFDPERDPGSAAITMKSGVTLNAGAGTLAVDLKTSTDKTNNGQGVATLLGLTAGSVTLSPATALGVTLNGTTPGDGTGSTYTQTVVTGPINLGGATLSVSDPGSFALGQSFVILTSTQPIAGTFAGLPEGGVFTAGQTFEVSYLNNQVTVRVIPLITFSPALLPNGTTGTAYSQTLTASGGTAPYGNFVVAGALPAGVTLSSGGTLSGTPTAAGFFAFTVRATDASPSPGPYPGQQTFTLVVTPPGFVYDPTTQTLTITASAAQNTFTYSQATAVQPGGQLATTDTFNLNGVPLSLPETLLHQVAVNAGPGKNTAVLIGNDTYIGVDGQAHETRETALLGTGGGVLEKYDANGSAHVFLTLSGFQTSYAYLGRADNGQLFDSPGNDIFVTAGSYSYMTGPSIFRLISGGSSVYGYTINGGSDQAWHYDAAGSIDAFVSSGSAYSYMSGTDQSGNAFFNVSVGFPVTYGISTHGNAIAYLLDSPGNDTFYGATTYSYMSGPGFFNVAEAFALVYAESFVGGTDYAYNYDPSHNILNSRWILLT